MRGFSRPSPGPECLKAVPVGAPWGDFGSPCKDQVRSALRMMQTDQGPALCAYCESVLGPGSGTHIEHFVPRSRNPGLTYEWHNLFLSCGHADHCGHYKDGRKAPSYNPSDLIRPDSEDPDAYLHFHSSGEVRVREGLSGGERTRAQTTIDVFNLNAPSLKAARRALITQARSLILQELDFLEVLEDEDRLEFLAEEIEAFRSEPHPTAVRHFFTHLV